LARLEKAGLVSKRKEAGQKRDKHVYSILPEGERKLREWLAESPKRQPPRSELLLKLFFLTPQETLIQRRHVMASRDRAVEELKHFGYIAEKLRAEHGGHPQLQQWLITLNFGRHQAEARVRWAEETLEMLDSAAPQETEEVKEGARR
jgi:DNA-binding PadR family transcriptional regulator